MENFQGDSVTVIIEKLFFGFKYGDLEKITNLNRNIETIIIINFTYHKTLFDFDKLFNIFDTFPNLHTVMIKKSMFNSIKHFYSDDSFAQEKNR